jgi:hypothetical protein
VDDWDQVYAEIARRKARGGRLRSLMFVVILTSALGSFLVILWLVANELWRLPLK